jgi:hypothetical protein
MVGICAGGLTISNLIAWLGHLNLYIPAVLIDDRGFHLSGRTFHLDGIEMAPFPQVGSPRLLLIDNRSEPAGRYRSQILATFESINYSPYSQQLQVEVI